MTDLEIVEQLKEVLRAYRRQHDIRYRIKKTDPMTPEDFDPTGEKCYCEICEWAKGLLGER